MAEICVPRRPNANPKNQLARLKRMAGNPDAAHVAYDRAVRPTAEKLGCSPDKAAKYVLQTVTDVRSL